MRRAIRPLFFTVAGVLAAAVCQPNVLEPAFAEETKPATKVSFAKDIHPLLIEKCGSCHGPKKAKKRIDYVTSYETTMKTVRPKKPDDSRLYRSVAGRGGKKMPPKSSLSDAEIAKIEAWIANGAKND